MIFNTNLIDVIRRIIAQETVFLKHFEGVVMNNGDPEMLGRVQVLVPELLWLTPDTMPWVHPEHGSNTVVPLIGASVAVYFLKGSRAHPIYRGGTNEYKSTRLKEYKTFTTAVLFEDPNIVILWDRTAMKLSIKIGVNEIALDGVSNALEVKSLAKVSVNAPLVEVTGGQLQVNGAAAPSGSGPFCGLLNCAFSGASHVGNIVSGT
jgi:hypothetical protein